MSKATWRIYEELMSPHTPAGGSGGPAKRAQASISCRVQHQAHFVRHGVRGEPFLQEGFSRSQPTMANESIVEKSLDLFDERLYKLKDGFGLNDYIRIHPELQGTRGALASATGP